MTQVVDYSFSRPSPQSIKGAGYVGVMRYLAPGPNSKVLTAGELADLLAHGLSVGVVWETVAARAASGFDAGKIDAQQANNMADALGLGGVTIYYAVDFDAAVAAVLPYFQGVASVGRRRFAPYGGFAVVEGILNANIGAARPWQTVAWSHGQRSVRAALYQGAGGRLPGTDENDCQTDDWGQWPRPNSPQPAPPPRRFKVNAVVSDPLSGETQIAELRDDGLVWLRNIKKDSAWYNAGALPKDAGKALSLDAGYRRDGTLDVSVRTDQGVTWLNGAGANKPFGGWYVP